MKFSENNAILPADQFLEMTKELDALRKLTKAVSVYLQKVGNCCEPEDDGFRIGKYGWQPCENFRGIHDLRDALVEVESVQSTD